MISKLAREFSLHIERKLQHLETEARRAFTEQSRLRRSSRSHRVA